MSTTNTIPSIPVEWIKEYVDGLVSGIPPDSLSPDALQRAGAIVTLVKAWRVFSTNVLQEGTE